MEDVVLSSFEDGVKKSYREWAESQWEINENSTLKDNWDLSIYPKGYRSDKENPRACLYLGTHLEGDDPIWKFFGINSEGNEKVYVYIALEDMGECKDANKAINCFDELYAEWCTENGLIRKGRSNPYYMKEISFDKNELLSGIENDDWETCLSPIRKVWQPLMQICNSELLNVLE